MWEILVNIYAITLLIFTTDPKCRWYYFFPSPSVFFSLHPLSLVEDKESEDGEKKETYLRLLRAVIETQSLTTKDCVYKGEDL